MTERAVVQHIQFSQHKKYRQKLTVFIGWTNNGIDKTAADEPILVLPTIFLSVMTHDATKISTVSQTYTILHYSTHVLLL